MNQNFMVEFDLPEEKSQTFIAKIPEHRLRINELMDKGIIISYSLSSDMLKLWCVIEAGSETEVEEIINSFPLIKMIKPKISKLLFNNNVYLKNASFSLN